MRLLTSDKMDLKKILEDVKNGTLTEQEAMEKLKKLPFEDLGFANIDHHRKLRTGYPEVIFSQGKTPEQVAEIMSRLKTENTNVLATRASKEHFNAVKEKIPDAQYNKLARTITLKKENKNNGKGRILIISAGTSDIPIAEEAAITAEIMGNEVERLFDVGVAGLQRILNNLEKLHSASVIICVAGMEGALPSVVSGLVSCPVIAVPTSVGYGAAFEGLAALLTMLNSCASGVTVVNIDNGFGAGYAASLINRKD